jgi:hypothetical protein
MNQYSMTKKSQEKIEQLKEKFIFDIGWTIEAKLCTLTDELFELGQDSRQEEIDDLECELLDRKTRNEEGEV